MNARDPQLPLQPDEAVALGDFTRRRWDEAIVPALTDYIAIPADWIADLPRRHAAARAAEVAAAKAAAAASAASR